MQTPPPAVPPRPPHHPPGHPPPGYRPPQARPPGQGPPPGHYPPPQQRPPPPPQKPEYDYGYSNQQQLMADLYARKLGSGFGKGGDERIIGEIKQAKGGQPTGFWNLFFTQERLIFVKTFAPAKHGAGKKKGRKSKSKSKSKKDQGDDEAAESAPGADKFEALKALPPEELLKIDMANHELKYQHIQAIDVHEGLGGAKLRIQRGTEKLKYSFSKDQYPKVCQIIETLFPSAA